MEPPQLLTEMQPVSECVQMVTTYLDDHIIFFVVVGILAVLGGVGMMEYTMRIAAGLLERGWEAWKARRTHG